VHFTCSSRLVIGRHSPLLLLLRWHAITLHGLLTLGWLTISLHRLSIALHGLTITAWLLLGWLAIALHRLLLGGLAIALSWLLAESTVSGRLLGRHSIASRRLLGHSISLRGLTVTLHRLTIARGRHSLRHTVTTWLLLLLAKATIALWLLRLAWLWLTRLLLSLGRLSLRWLLNCSSTNLLHQVILLNVTSYLVVIDGTLKSHQDLVQL